MRIFNREEAVALLPRLRILVVELLAARRALAIALLEEQTAQRMRPTPGAAGREQAGAEQLHEAQLRIVERVEKIESHGCVVKDVDLGLVDFPALQGEELVNLCWKLDEPDIAFWHGMDEGFAARKPIAETRL